jgi:hypothetical protein
MINDRSTEPKVEGAICRSRSSRSEPSNLLIRHQTGLRPSPANDQHGSQSSGDQGPFSYWSRWFTARRLAEWRRKDPDRMRSMERLAAVAGFNLQLDESQGDLR